MFMKSTFKVFDSDDFGCNHVISPMTQSHDCRDILTSLHMANPNFKATLFTIPGEVTTEILGWATANRDWIELAWHGFYHRDNYECEKLTYAEFDKFMAGFQQIYGDFFVKGFKAPGWQISDDIYRWLSDNNFWVADQAYNNERRLKLAPELKTYVNNDGKFYAWPGTTYHPEEIIIPAIHTHTWDCVGNGVYELADSLLEQVKETKDWKFVSEVLDV